MLIDVREFDIQRTMPDTSAKRISQSTCRQKRGDNPRNHCLLRHHKLCGIATVIKNLTGGGQPRTATWKIPDVWLRDRRVAELPAVEHLPGTGGAVEAQRQAKGRTALVRVHQEMELPLHVMVGDCCSTVGLGAISIQDNTHSAKVSCTTLVRGQLYRVHRVGALERLEVPIARYRGHADARVGIQVDRCSDVHPVCLFERLCGYLRATPDGVVPHAHHLVIVPHVEHRLLSMVSRRICRNHLNGRTGLASDACCGERRITTLCGWQPLRAVQHSTLHRLELTNA